jgi:hypothetical protein
MYYFLLTKNDKDIGNNFSYSKRYRLLKNLFKSGFIAKIKNKDKDTFYYGLLPPPFLAFNTEEYNLIEFLEKIYIKNFGNLIDSNYSQVILKDEKSFVIYLLKYLMKKNAKILSREYYFNKIKGVDLNKIEHIKNKGDNLKTMGVIDGILGFEFYTIQGNGDYDKIGYITKKIDPNKKDYVSEIEKSLNIS